MSPGNEPELAVDNNPQGTGCEVRPDGKRFLWVSIPSREYGNNPGYISNRAEVLLLLSKLLTLGKVQRLVDVKESGQYREMYYSVEADFNRADLERVAAMYYNAVPLGMVMNHIGLVDCECTEEDECHELHIRDIRTDFRFDYTTAANRLEKRHGELLTDEDSAGKLLEIVRLAERMDPTGEMDFDARLNKMPAVGFGCEDVVQHQVRQAPFGPEHIPEQELKTLCFEVKVSRPKGAAPFIIMVNTMANRRVNMSVIKEMLKEAGLGNKFDVVPANIEETFGIKKGEVHPLSLPPRRAEVEGQHTVIHIYDGKLQQKRYVTTNGGHPDWTTEFRSDAFVNCMTAHYNSEGAQPLVYVGNISAMEGEEEQQVDTVKPEAQWVHTVEQITEGTRIIDSIGKEKRAAILVTETTMLFANMVREVLPGLLRKESSHKYDVVLHKFTQPTLDFDIVKFPQCWSEVFEQLAVAIATMVKEGINTVFLDCNIAPLEEILADKMPRPVKEYVIRILRENLADKLSEVSDPELLAKINEQLVLLSKPVVIADHLRAGAVAGKVKEVYVVGGAQLADPSISKYHDQLMAISEYVKIHTLDPEQSRDIRDAMYFAEYKEGAVDSKLQNVLQLYHVVRPMLEAIEASEKPVIMLASTSLCQAYHENGNEIIPGDMVAELAEKLKISIETLEAERTRINSIMVLNTTTVYAEVAARAMASGILTRAHSYV